MKRSRSLTGAGGNSSLALGCELSVRRDYRFGPFLFDTERGDLRRDGVPVAIGGRARKLLTALLAQEGGTAGKEALIKAGWAGLHVEDANLAVQILALRQILGDTKKPYRWITTVPGLGYRFNPDISPAPAAAVAVASPFGPPPATATVIGRESALAGLHATMCRHRLVTVVGAGGIGKTTLALTFADECAADPRDAPVYLPLDGLRRPGQVAHRLAAALGLSASPGQDPLALAVNALRNLPRLIIFDNCEHLRAEAASVAAEVLRRAPEATMLATSREPLALPAEFLVRLKPLECPAPAAEITLAQAAAFSAVRLFALAAVASDPAFRLDDATTDIVAGICRRLEGMPLAIKLAASRLSGMSLAALAADLAAQDFLPAPLSDKVPPRQRTIEATIAWSVALLDPAPRALLLRLGVFAGSFSAAGAGAVAPAGLPAAAVTSVLATLADKSLILAEPPRFNEIRYRLLESTRVFARRHAAGPEETGCRIRVLAQLTAVYTQGDLDWQTMPSDKWLAIYAPDIDNVREGLDWAFGPGRRHEGAILAGQKLVCGLGNLAFDCGLQRDYAAWAQTALDLADELTPTDVKLFLRAALADGTVVGAAQHGEILAACVDRHRAAGNHLALSGCLVMLAVSHLGGPTGQLAEPYLGEAETMARQLNYRHRLGYALAFRAVARDHAGDRDGQEILARECLALAQENGFRRLAQEARCYLAEIAFDRGRPEEAIRLAHASIRSCQDEGLPATAFFMWMSLAGYCALGGDAAGGRAAIAGAVRCYTGDANMLAKLAFAAALVAASTGQPEIALGLTGFAQAAYSRLGGTMEDRYAQIYQTTLKRLPATCTQTSRDRLAQTGATWDEATTIDVLKKLQHPDP